MHFLFWTKGSHQSPNFDSSNCSGEKLPNSSCYFSNHKSLLLQTLHDTTLSWKIIPLYFFRSNIIYFAQKVSIKVHIFETFECSDPNSPNSCHFWNKKLVFRQTFHHCSVSWNITPLYLFSWKFIYFQQKESLEVKFGGISREQLKV